MIPTPSTDVERSHLLEAIKYRWSFHARSEQLPPSGDWRTWIYLAGRGAGKTRSGAELIREWAETKRYRRIHLIAPTASDVRDTMVEGESGILSVSTPQMFPKYEPSKRRLTWPNGVIASLFSADEPERFRGPQCEALWADELCAWRYEESWNMAMFGLRLGNNPRAFVSTTPKPTKLIRRLLKANSTVITRGTTYDNRANLAAAFFEDIIKQYEGTRLGRQELMAELLDDNPHALWKREWLDRDRISVAPALDRIVVGVDPAITIDGDAIGIIVAGANRAGFYILGDYTMHGTPKQWADKVAAVYHAHKADMIMAESNQGGLMVKHTIHTADKTLPVKLGHASRGKHVRAEPISLLYEQGKVHHVGCFAALEDEQCDWMPGDPDSPNRIDALVWAMSELNKRPGKAVIRTR